jgi:hypothetical protein
MQLTAPPAPQFPPPPAPQLAPPSAPVASAEVAAPVAPAGPVLRCPTCGSDEVRRLSVVHADGLSTVKTVGLSKPAGHGAGHHPQRESIATAATMQSLASAQAAPPARREPLLVGCGALICMLLAGIVLGLIASVPGFLIGAGVVGWIFWRQLQSARRWNADEYPALLAQWQRTFRCDHCGARFQAEV